MQGVPGGGGAGVPMSSSFCALVCNCSTRGCSCGFCSTTAGSNKTVELVLRSFTLTAPLSTLPSPTLDCFSRPAAPEQHDWHEQQIGCDQLQVMLVLCFAVITET